MKVFWKRSPSPGNFGDILTPLFLDHFGINYTYEAEDFDTIAIGSIASLARSGTTVLGSGLMTSYYNVSADADWKFVRGPFTRQRVLQCGGQCPEVYGDLAMLLPLICDSSNKEYDVGIVPHYTDYEAVSLMYPDHYVVNLLNEDPLSVAKQITKCRSIVSSSLHGIICAHAYGIPAAWIEFGSSIKGDGVKFRDHYAAVNADCQLSTWENMYFSLPNYDTTPVIDVMKNLAYEQRWKANV